MPYQKQEVPIIIIGYLVNAIEDELEIEAMQVGALLLEKEELQRAIEPDTCFYIQHQALVKLLRHLNCMSKKIKVLWGGRPARPKFTI